MTEHRKLYLKEYSRKYYLANKERLITKGIQWNKQNKERRAAITARHRIKRAISIKQYNLAHRLEQKNRNLQFQHDITLMEYNKLFADQQGLCLGCKKHQSQFRLAFAVDHDHKTGKVRGLLCGQCNTTIGLVKENIETLHRLADYLNKFAYIPTVR